MNADDIRSDLEASRRAIRRDYRALRAELDFVARTKRAVVDHPLPWLGGSALVGWILSGRKRRKARRLKPGEVPEPVKKFGLLGILVAVVRLIFPIAQPYLTNFAVGKLSNFAAKYRR
jgi:pilus assembly protein TadC